MKYRDLVKKNDLENFFHLSASEKEYFNKATKSGLPVKLNSYWAGLCSKDPNHPLRLQAIPRVEEMKVLNYENADPLGDSQHSPVPRMVHRYPDRILILVTQRCALYCRHCFRRHFTGTNQSDISNHEIDQILHYISTHQEIHEVILSGGDSFLLHPVKIKKLLKGIRSINPKIVIRMGTRLPVTAPYKIKRSLLNLFKGFAPLWVLVQVNHPDEITNESARIFKALQKRGISILNQSVLLKNINDRWQTLRDLNYKLIEHGVKPYYIFQGDLAAGTSHFRVSLDRCYQIMTILRRNVSGIAMPRFAVDLPGGGKIPLQEDYFIRKDEDFAYFKNLEGETFLYPMEKNK